MNKGQFFVRKYLQVSVGYYPYTYLWSPLITFSKSIIGGDKYP